MADRENVIAGLEDIQKHLNTGYSFAISWKSKLIRDTLELLKEQEHKDKMFHALEDDWKRLKELLKEQEAIIEQYHKADTFLETHGWTWEGR